VTSGPLTSAALVLALLVSGACRGTDAPSSAGNGSPPSVLLITLDTTRADAIGPEARGVETPSFNALAARGLRFRHAYAAAPETLPSHASMMTGLYPGGHGIHENARTLGPTHPVLAEQLQQKGYRTAAFVSSFVLARRFGLARGFATYDDEQPAGHSERSAADTTERALAYLSQAGSEPLFLWVHYFDPHAPYAPPEEFRSQYAANPYFGEVAAMDRQIGRLIVRFDQHASAHGRPAAIVAAGDHGEGLGDHGESQHGNLLYQSTMRVPLVIAGPGVTAGVSDTPVSIRRVFHTMLEWAGGGAANGLRSGETEVVLGEAMRPYLAYGWLPQIMAVHGTQKAISAGRTEVYDLAADPAEARDLGSGANLPAAMRNALDGYPVPSIGAAKPPQALTDEARRALASLGYVNATAAPAVRRDAPRPADMAHLFETLETASRLFVEERYRDVIPVLRKVLAADPHNLDAALRLGTSHSMLGQGREALEAFQRAARIAPRSPDVRVYLALHYARGPEWARAVPELERAVKEDPGRLPALLALGDLAMRAQNTPAAIEAFEKARALQGPAFRHDLELGVLYLAARRFDAARSALDRVPPSHPQYPMVLFKRAQVSVLLAEPDRAARIEAARKGADRTTRELIEKERLFQQPADRSQ
jgi:arylsulfatase A-like enzyme/Tfp pilus assembly protein PilF